MRACLLQRLAVIERADDHRAVVSSRDGDFLAVLAHMPALAAWRRWQPINAHRALLARARPGDVAAAFGESLAETYRHWRERVWG